MQKDTRNLALDGIRGFAVLIVFLSHTAGRDQALAPWLQFQGIGHVGVYLFFVLSAYLLTDNLLNEHERSENISLQHFFVRRFLRIAPLYYLVLTLVFVFQINTNQLHGKYLHINDGVAGYIKHLLFFQGDGVFWTIPAEFSFYFILPFLVIGMLKLGNKAIFYVAIFAVIYFLWAILCMVNILPSYLSPRIVQISHHSQFLDVFLCGLLGAYIQRMTWFKELLNQYGRRIGDYGFLLFAFILLITFCLISYQFFGFKRPLYEFRWLSLFYGVGFSLVILSTQVIGYSRKIFEVSFFRFVGIVGFSWYLIHFFVLQQVNQLALQAPVKFIISFLGCATLSYLLFLMVEKPFIQLSKRLTKI